MVGRSEREQQLAVRQCLSRCYEAAAPLSSLASFAQQLKQQGWERHEVREVELAVMRLLAGVMGRERERPLSEGA
jgi:hypothetical protein